MTAARAAALLAVAVATACTDPLPAANTAEHAVAIWRSDGDFFDLPFPENTRLSDDGGLDLSGFPNPASLTILDDFLADIGAAWRGFGTNSALYMRFGNAPESADLPSATDTTRGDSRIVLVDVDAASPEFGRRRPLLVSWYPLGSTYLPPGTLSVLPVPGFPLRPRTTYALLIYDGFAGWSIDPQPAFLMRLEREDAAGVRTLTRRGDLRGDPRAGLVFTTSDPVGELVHAAEVVSSEAMATLVTWTALPDLGACRRVEAFLDETNFQSGVKPYARAGGYWIDDARGTPIPQGVDRVRVVMSIPRGPMPEGGWPTLIMAHGTGSDADSWSYTHCADPEPRDYCPVDRYSATRGYCYCVDVLCAAGIASVSPEQPLHGTRLPEDAVLDESVLTFNLFNIRAIPDNIRQGAVDLVSLFEWLADLSAPATVFPLGETFAVDADRLMFMGHSQGTNTGIPFLALRGRKLRGAVLSGASGGLHLALKYKVDPIDLPTLLEAGLSTYGDFPLDHPALQLFQTFAEVADTLNYGRYLVGESIDGAGDFRPLHLFISEGIVDGYTPPPLLEALATTIDLEWIGPELQPIEPFAYLNRHPTAGTSSGNLAYGGVTYTTVLTQYPEGHFSLFENPDGGRAFTRFIIDVASGAVPEVEPRGR